MIEAGWYYDPAHSGWGLNVVKVSEAMGVVTLYLNSPADGQPVWLQAIGTLGGRMTVERHVGAAFPGVKRETRAIRVGTLTLSPPSIDGDLHVSIALEPQAHFSGPQFSPPPPQSVWSGWLTKLA